MNYIYELPIKASSIMPIISIIWSIRAMSFC